MINYRSLMVEAVSDQAFGFDLDCRANLQMGDCGTRSKPVI
ncbi:hypothetical protein X771_08430 [Mesorhizobium sp. LSJC277A00]|nr:hypothetical protein X771_08430 [Mesorhizobium sp. LSJC277A00]